MYLKQYFNVLYVVHTLMNTLTQFLNKWISIYGVPLLQARSLNKESLRIIVEQFLQAKLLAAQPTVSELWKNPKHWLHGKPLTGLIFLHHQLTLALRSLCSDSICTHQYERANGKVLVTGINIKMHIHTLQEHGLGAKVRKASQTMHKTGYMHTASICQEFLDKLRQCACSQFCTVHKDYDW